VGTCPIAGAAMADGRAVGRVRRRACAL